MTHVCINVWEFATERMEKLYAHVWGREQVCHFVAKMGGIVNIPG